MFHDDEIANLRRELMEAERRADELEREADRLRHGNTIEGDFICPNELAVAQLKAERDELRSALVGMCCLAEDAAFNRDDAADFQSQIDRVRKLADDIACPRCTAPGRWLGLTVKVHSGVTPNDSVVANRAADTAPKVSP